VREAPCHFTRPFLDRQGNLYPCCFVNAQPEFIIGNVRDDDLVEKLYAFDTKCQCGFHKFRKWKEGDKLGPLNIQTSLMCHGKCAVCYVSAPLKKETVELDYDKALEFLRKLKPTVLFMEGGEVPLQKRALQFVANIKKEINPQVLHLLTNGCYKPEMATRLADLFNRFTVSYMGFSKNVYYHETMLDVDVTNAFTREIHRRVGDIGFRYICTPLSMIEAGDFLNFAVELTKSHVIYADCDINQYVKNPEATPMYWPQVIQRAQMRFKEALLLNRDKLKENNFVVKFEPRTAALLGITEEFVKRLKVPNIQFY